MEKKILEKLNIKQIIRDINYLIDSKEENEILSISDNELLKEELLLVKKNNSQILLIKLFINNNISLSEKILKFLVDYININKEFFNITDIIQNKEINNNKYLILFSNKINLNIDEKLNLIFDNFLIKENSFINFLNLTPIKNDLLDKIKKNKPLDYEEINLLLILNNCFNNDNILLKELFFYQKDKIFDNFFDFKEDNFLFIIDKLLDNNENIEYSKFIKLFNKEKIQIFLENNLIKLTELIINNLIKKDNFNHSYEISFHQINKLFLLSKYFNFEEKFINIYKNKFFYEHNDLFYQRKYLKLYLRLNQEKKLTVFNDDFIINLQKNKLIIEEEDLSFIIRQFIDLYEEDKNKTANFINILFKKCLNQRKISHLPNRAKSLVL